MRFRLGRIPLVLVMGGCPTESPSRTDLGPTHNDGSPLGTGLTGISDWSTEQPRGAAPKFDALQTFIENTPVWW